jgi:hypothetical protein
MVVMGKLNRLRRTSIAFQATPRVPPGRLLSVRHSKNGNCSAMEECLYECLANSSCARFFWTVHSHEGRCAISFSFIIDVFIRACIPPWNGFFYPSPVGSTTLHISRAPGDLLAYHEVESGEMGPSIDGRCGVETKRGEHASKRGAGARACRVLPQPSSCIP